MTDRRAELLRAVVDSPDEEAPRLAYAAWCDAQGDPRGEFIRLQIEASRALRKVGYGPLDYWKPSKAAKELLERYRVEWTRDVATLASEVTFYRGFPEAITGDASTFLSVGEELCRRAPIRHAHLRNARPVIAELAASPLLHRLVALQIYDKALDDEGAITLLQSPHLSRLKHLELAFCGIGRPGLEALFAAEQLRELVYVNLTGNRFEDPTEKAGQDQITMQMMKESIVFPRLGAELEARYGYKAWLHGPSLLLDWPPLCESW